MSAVAVSLMAACTGEIGDSLPQASIAAEDACAVAPPRGLTFNRLRRFSSAEITNTLEALLGPTIFSDDDIQQRLHGIPIDQTIAPGDFSNDAPAALAGTIEQISKRAAGLAIEDPAWLSVYTPTCASADALNDGCVQNVIDSLGARIARRDLTPDESATYLSFYHAMGGGKDGLYYLLRRLYQSPTLTFHVEDGVASADVPGSVRLSDFEVASRISYFIGDTMPDDELTAAARAGSLQTPDGVRAQVLRLLDTSAARAKVRDFFRYYAHLGEVPDPIAAQGARIGITSTTGLGQQMRDEAFEYFETIFWNGGTFAELMSSPDAYPHSAELAAVFGVAAIPEGAPGTATPAHVGLLHRPALLTSPTQRTSPILRGAHLRKLFLCDELGMPPVEAVSAREGEVGNIDNMSNRDRVTLLTDSQVCLGCHANINKTGFAFEAFDALGAPRGEEVVLDGSGAVSATWPLDTSLKSLTLDEQPADYANSQELAYAIADSEIGRACITQRFFEYYRLAETAKADACTVSLGNVASVGGSIASVLVALIANDDIFWRKEP